MSTLQEAIEWENPMTSRQAAKYFLTKGFVAAELYEAMKRDAETARHECPSCHCVVDERGHGHHSATDCIFMNLDVGTVAQRTVERCIHELESLRDAYDKGYMPVAAAGVRQGIDNLRSLAAPERVCSWDTAMDGIDVPSCHQPIPWALRDAVIEVVRGGQEIRCPGCGKRIEIKE